MGASAHMNDDSPGSAVAWMLFASFSFGSMNALVKWASPEADVWSMVFVRSMVIAVAIFFICRRSGITLIVEDRRSMLLRCITGLIAMILYFSALGLIPIGQAVTLQYTNPLFVALLSSVFVSEKVEPIVWSLAIISFIGIVLIVSPDLQTIEVNAVLALGSGFFAAIAYLYVRRLRASEHALSIVFWFATFSVAFTFIPAMPTLPKALSDPVVTLALVGIGVGAIVCVIKYWSKNRGANGWGIPLTKNAKNRVHRAHASRAITSASRKNFQRCKAESTRSALMQQC